MSEALKQSVRQSIKQMEEDAARLRQLASELDDVIETTERVLEEGRPEAACGLPIQYFKQQAFSGGIGVNALKILTELFINLKESGL